jgi:ADP-ribosylglycohydrolase
MSPNKINAFEGALVADALAMPVHWYYDRLALKRDYGRVDRFMAPKNPHPDSILHRSQYTPVNANADILHDQAVYWGQRGVHYHQNLRAGENTLNFQLARALYRQISKAQAYDSGAWLRLYVDCMRLPGWHRDTYVEEYHRGFFTNFAKGRPLEKCGINDIHIGGLVPVPALFAALHRPEPLAEPPLEDTVSTHVKLTHNDPDVIDAARAFAKILRLMESGVPLRDAIILHGNRWISARKLEKWSSEADETVVGQRLSPACYINDAFAASLYLSWKYADDFTAGLIANAHCGGDNCHRGAVIGALLGFANGVPEPFLSGLRTRASPEGSIP